MPSPSIFDETNHEGTDDEKRKFKLIKMLFLKIEDLSHWLDVANVFEDVMCIKLALSNIGTTVDEDIDITLYLPKDVFRSLDELPLLTEDTIRFLSHNCDMKEILGISATATYDNYDSSIKKTSKTVSYRSPSFLNGDINYEENYQKDLEGIFCYKIYPESDYYIVKLKFDYLKHHTTVAFPAVIFLKNKTDMIEYNITSKNSAEVICGELMVE